MSKNTYKAVWTGGYPNLCSGEWELYVNEARLTIDFPWGESMPANTWGRYCTWLPIPEFFENFETEYEGLGCHDWIEEYQDWLEQHFPREDWGAVFRAFQDEDWRRCCGGCI